MKCADPRRDLIICGQKGLGHEPFDSDRLIRTWKWSRPEISLADV
jgi:hypothetical protein